MKQRLTEDQITDLEIMHWICIFHIWKKCTAHIISFCESERSISLREQYQAVGLFFGRRFVFRPSVFWGSKKPSLIAKSRLVAKSQAKLRKAELCSNACLRNQWIFPSSKTKHKEVWEVGAEVQRLVVDRCSYKCLHNPVWERIKNVAIHHHKTHLNFSLKCSFVRATCEIEVHLKLA